MAAIGAVTAIAGLIQNAQAQRQQQSAFVKQERAQQQAVGQAAKQQRTNAENINRANQKKPDIAALLASSQQFGLGGIGGTNLTGGSKAPLGG